MRVAGGEFCAVVHLVGGHDFVGQLCSACVALAKGLWFPCSVFGSEIWGLISE